jgi:hypothetical protein
VPTLEQSARYAMRKLGELRREGRIPADIELPVRGVVLALREGLDDLEAGRRDWPVSTRTTSTYP